MKMNKAAASLLYQRNLGTTALRYHIIFVRGNTHTATELDTLFNATNGIFTNIATLITQIGSRGGAVLAQAELITTQNPAMKANFPSLLDFDWSKVAPTVMVSGQPDWFLIYPRTTNVAYNANGASNFLIRGSITDFSGDGDLRVGNRNMTVGEIYEMTNCKIRQVGHE